MKDGVNKLEQIEPKGDERRQEAAEVGADEVLQMLQQLQSSWFDCSNPGSPQKFGEENDFCHLFELFRTFQKP